MHRVLFGLDRDGVDTLSRVFGKQKIRRRRDLHFVVLPDSVEDPASLIPGATGDFWLGEGSSIDGPFDVRPLRPS